jgi:DNA-binding MarR family transcriptional regulator
VSPSRERTGLGPKLRRAWVGYQGRLDDAMAKAGFDDRRLPDARVLRMCAPPAQTTISDIGRELSITRQGASKIVASLRARRYVAVVASPTSAREKIVKLTPRAVEFLAARDKAARAIERQLRREVGDESFAALDVLLQALAGGEDLRMRQYLQNKGIPVT